MGATMLLLYAVRMVQTGIERAFGSSFRRIVIQAGGPVRSTASGVFLAILLQSSAAVALLVAGFASTGMVSFAAGIAMVLGADLGSALVIQMLSFQLDWLLPLLLAVGGGFFVKSSGQKLKQAGRIILGIAFILISLRFLRETMDPIRESHFFPIIATYLQNDFITAFIVGASIAFLMHSSVAAILMCVTLVAIDAISISAGMSIVLGANLGSSFIPVWLARGMPPSSQRIVVANCFLRGSSAFLAVIVVENFDVLQYLAGATNAQSLINIHLAFNAALLVFGLFGSFLEKPFKSLLPDVPAEKSEFSMEHRSVLDESVLSSPQLALSSVKREILRMLQLVETMSSPIMGIFEKCDKDLARTLVAEDQYVNTALDRIRRYISKLPVENMTKEDRKLAHELAEYAISVESAGDIVVKRLVHRALQKEKEGVKFSKEGKKELVIIHEKLMANIGLAANVLISDDLESARLLLEEKTEMAKMERASRKKHLKRLDEGTEVSFDSSNIHLETLRALKDMNSQISAVAYPILYRAGQLLETRLINNMEKQ